ncbi:T9SS type A sorting domain-containing protein [Mariniflexile sp. AS56]|uniref:T9SS type A sorting domain-containing protein n=1 Tax=Mariniflexile sp. AS56 TaxID=3063957 RepID=UPI0026F3022C|nr:T9SS type A sorting domain-containing protein [Mariniflexile sp. AS56]MDO7172379.1 T9SS type A sorting domain-containing protein [Mariniflexile sp. AS56]
MKKIYSTILLLTLNFLVYSQGPEFTIDFEGTDPLNNLPSGVTSVDPDNTRGNVLAFVGANVYFFETDGGDIVQQDTGVVEDRAQFANTIFTDGGNKLLQTDYTGHIIINETALGTDSFTLRLNYMVFGHGMGSTDCGIITIVGNDAGVWKSDRITSRNGGFTTGLDITAIGTATGGFPYGTVEPTSRDFVITYNATDKLYRLYKDGALSTTSTVAQPSGEWDTRKVYLGFSGRNSIGSGDGVDHINTATGEFTANGVRNDGRTADLQTRMDNIQVYQRAISDAEVTTLFNGGTLSAYSQTKEIFSAYPNPVVDYLNFSSKDVYSVDIYNILGAKVSSQNALNGVDMTKLNKGIYLVKTKNNKGLDLATIKVVKK